MRGKERQHRYSAKVTRVINQTLGDMRQMLSDMKLLFAIAMGATLALVPATYAVDSSNPIPDPITKSGLTIELEDFVTIPASGGLPLARLNLLMHAGDGSGRLFVVDMRGSIWVIKDGALLPTPLIDMAIARSNAFVSNLSGETGVASFAFHPDFENEGTAGYGKVYIMSTENTSSGTPDWSLPAGAGTATHHDVVSEWSIDPNNPDRIDTTSRRELLRIPQPLADHNANQLAFNPHAQPGDPDFGLLYVGVGDGGNTPPHYGEVCYFRTGQDTLNPLGSIMRIDPMGNNSGNGNYGIPVNNPFVGNASYLPELWAYGLRNPQRFYWDLGGNQDLLIGDIGQAKIEEINLGVAGANYGWSDREGTFVVDHNDQYTLYDLPVGDSGYTYPVLQYDHDEGFAICGGFVYRGPAIPELEGKYIFGDLVKGRLFYSDASNLSLGTQSTIDELTIIHNGVEKTLLQIVGQSRADLRFGLAENGTMFVLTKQDGVVRRIKGLNEAEMVIDQTVFNPTVYIGSSLPDDTFSISNVGSGTLSYTITEDSNWLSVSPTAGSTTAGPEPILISYNTAALPKGEYQAEISVEANTWDSPVKVVVNLSVETVLPDFDGDTDVDMEDFGYLQACITGNATPISDPGCLAADLNDDNYVNTTEVTALTNCLSGANLPADPTCDDSL